MSQPTRVKLLVVLAMAIGGISLAAPLIRLSSAHPVAIAIWRVVISLGLIGVALAATRGWDAWRTLTRREIVLALAAGAMLALHFWSWNTSLLYTSIAASVILVNLQPAIVAVASALWLREAPTGRQWLGIAIAMAGAASVVFASGGNADVHGAGSRPMLGNTLALFGAVTAALYYLTGRRLRRKLELVPYVTLVYSACLGALLMIAALVNAPLLPQPGREWAIFTGLAIGPMLLGHTGMNWALGHLPAYVVNITVLGEPVGAILLGALLPGIREVPTAGVLAGGALVLGGILLALPRRETGH